MVPNINPNPKARKTIKRNRKAVFDPEPSFVAPDCRPDPHGGVLLLAPRIIRAVRNFHARTV
jgi:hypothetical protein